MSATRSEEKAISGEFKTYGRLIQAIKLPNGNFLCEHSLEKHGHTHISIFDPIKRETIAIERTVTKPDNFVYDDTPNFLHPISNNQFLYQRKGHQVVLLELKDNKICEVKRIEEYYHPLFLGADNTLIGRHMTSLGKWAIDTIDIETLTVKKSETLTKAQSTPFADIYRKGWAILPSGRFLTFPHGKPIDGSKAVIFNVPHDDKPIKELEFKNENISIKHGAAGLSNNLVYYHADDKLCLIQNILTNKTRQFTFAIRAYADLGDHRVLIHNRQGFFLLDETSLELSQVDLGFDPNKVGTSISCSDGVIAITFRDCEMLYALPVSALIPKEVMVNTIMDTVLTMPKPLAGIIEEYQKFSLFNREVKSEPEDKTINKTHKM